jgi:hypothetical protein
MKRWIIRSFFIGLLLLFAGGWVVSGTRKGEIDYARNGCFVQCGTESGVVWMGSNGKRGGTGIPDGWIFAVIPNGARFAGPPAHFWPLGPSQIPSFLGFGFLRSSPAFFSVCGVAYLGVPYWFLIVLFYFILLFGWRKTRPTVRGFPLELVKSSGSP